MWFVGRTRLIKIELIKKISVSTLVRDVSIQDRITMKLVPLCGLCTRWIDPCFQIGIDLSPSLPPEMGSYQAAILLQSPVFSGASFFWQTCSLSSPLRLNRQTDR